ncbi:GMC oxidoreductase [Apiospora arundinis]
MRPATRPGQSPPSRDPWYTAPPGFEAQAPGAVLRVRPAPAGFVGPVADSVSGAYQVLYRSTDTRDQPSWAVTTVFLPRAGGQQRGSSSNTTTITITHKKLVSYQFPYNTVDVDQSPSYRLPTVLAGNGIFFVREGLARGWVVSVPDFEGPLAAFTAYAQAGHAVLDGIRAVLQIEQHHQQQEPGRRHQAVRPERMEYGLWGYSGGAFATNAAAELQASYAPELLAGFVGVAMGGVPTNFTQVLYTYNKRGDAGVVPLILVGVTAQYPAAREYLLGQLREEGPYNATVFLSLLHSDGATILATFAKQDIFSYFKDGEAILKAPEMAQALGENWGTTNNKVPQMPVFVAHAVHDESTLIGPVDERVKRLCKEGANILYQRNTVGGHEDEFKSGQNRALRWLGELLDGDRPEPRKECKIEDITDKA